MSTEIIKQLTDLFPQQIVVGKDGDGHMLEGDQPVEIASSASELYLKITNCIFSAFEQQILTAFENDGDVNRDAVAKLISASTMVSSIENQLRQFVGNSASAIDLSHEQLNFIKTSMSVPEKVREKYLINAVDATEIKIYGHDLQSVFSQIKWYLELCQEGFLSVDALRESLPPLVKGITRLRTEFFSPISPLPLLTFEKLYLKALHDYKGDGSLQIDSDNTVWSSGSISSDKILAGSVFALRLISNILSNARRAYESVNRKKRPVRISSKIATQPDGSRRYIFQSEDEGPGFPNAQHIYSLVGDFVPFEPTGATSWQGDVVGTGTGLKGLLTTLQPLIDAGEAGYEMGTYFNGKSIGGARTTLWWKIHKEPL